MKERMTSRAIATIFFCLLGSAGSSLTGCEEAHEPGVVDPHTEPVAWMMAHSPDYLEEEGPGFWRRDRLEETLWRPDLSYSSRLLGSYGFGEEEGWDLLPIHDFPTEPVMANVATEQPETLWSMPIEAQGLLEEARARYGKQDESTWTEQEWRAFGAEVFWRMPMRRDNYFDWLVMSPQLWDRYGLERGEDGALLGVTRYRDARGRARVGMTCALCHAAGGEEGRANEALDLGGARAAFRRAQGWDEGVFASWGAGKVDVTDDEVLDPTAIPNLWGMKHQSYFNASGVIRVETPASAAIRFETQYMMNHGYEVRAPRAFTWALAMYLYGLDEPARGDVDARGEALFLEKCASCHDPSRGYSGGLIPASALVGSDMLASTSLDRGTGHYRVPSLIGAGQGGPYLHDSGAPDLEALLLERKHPQGEDLDARDAEHLLKFLKGL